jgi:hypothetical protein
LKKLSNGLTLGFLKPKYLIGRRGRCAIGFLHSKSGRFENGEGFQGGHKRVWSIMSQVLNSISGSKWETNLTAKDQEDHNGCSRIETHDREIIKELYALVRELEKVEERVNENNR